MRDSLNYVKNSLQQYDISGIPKPSQAQANNGNGESMSDKFQRLQNLEKIHQVLETQFSKEKAKITSQKN